MSTPIRIGITGYGNLGRGAEAAITQSPDLELVALVTRRDPATVTPANPETPVVHLDDVADLQVLVDVMLCCGGSKEDLPVQGPLLASMFNIVDSYDTHAKIPDYFASVDAPARANNTTAVISTGWDPGLFSINRLMGEVILPEGATYSFWGRGLSQGHSDAVRRVDGVAAGVQYTNPTSDAVARARSGERPELTTREKHTRHCFVVLTDGADADEVEQAIVTMPDYFVDYDTTVTLIDADTLAAEQRLHRRRPRPHDAVLPGARPQPVVHRRRGRGLRPCRSSHESGG